MVNYTIINVQFPNYQCAIYLHVLTPSISCQTARDKQPLRKGEATDGCASRTERRSETKPSGLSRTPCTPPIQTRYSNHF